MSESEFYIGYQSEAPAGVAARTRRFVAVSLAIVALCAVLAAIGFQALPRATFEFGNVRSFEGTISTAPYPALYVERPHVVDSRPAASRYHLVAPFKWGADELVAGLDGKLVQLEGTLVHRDGQSMIEVVPGSVVEVAGEALEHERVIYLGEHRLIGEIVDSKCFLGVMNPGNLKPHRACAVRCISGGIPPVLCVRDKEGRAEYFLLVGENGEALNQAVLDLVALPVEVAGDVERLGDQLFLRTSADRIKSL